MFLLSFCLLFLPIQNVNAESIDYKEWFTDDFQSKINANLDKINTSWEKNWNLNMANHIVKTKKGKTLDKLDELRKDIKKAKKDINKIEVTRDAAKAQKKKVKKVKKYILEALSIRDSQVKKATKYINKDKEISSTSKFDKRLKKSDKQIEKANKLYLELQKELKIETSNIELIETNTIDKNIAKDILKKEKDEQAKEKKKKEAEIEVAEERKEKETEKNKEQEEKELKELEMKKEENRKNFDKTIIELINIGQGTILDIKPADGDDWIATYVYIDNSWYLLTPEEKKYFAEQVGPIIENSIIGSGIVDYCDVYFVDQKGNKVASPKLMGGYKIHN